MSVVADNMSSSEGSALRVDEIQLGYWKVQVSGPQLFVRVLTRVLQSLALPNDNLPPLLVTIDPDGRYATGTLRGGPQWSVALPQHGWLSVLAGQVVASATALFQQFLFIHAGAIGLNGHGLVIVGESGAGKTSTVGALVRNGGVYFSDEVALLEPVSRTIHPFMFPMAVKPWTKKATGRLPICVNVAQESKVQFLLPARVADAPLTVDAFILLKPTRGRAQLASISRANMLLNIATHPSSFSYRHRCEEAFAGFGRLLQSARCYVLESSSPAKTIERFQEIFVKPAK